MAAKKQREALILLGSRISELRKAKGMSQRQLADYMGKDRQSLHRIEKGYVNPGYLWLLQVCEALEVEIPDLLREL